MGDANGMSPSSIAVAASSSNNKQRVLLFCIIVGLVILNMFLMQQDIRLLPSPLSLSQKRTTAIIKSSSFQTVVVERVLLDDQNKNSNDQEQVANVNDASYITTANNHSSNKTLPTLLSHTKKDSQPKREEAQGQLEVTDGAQNQTEQKAAATIDHLAYKQPLQLPSQAQADNNGKTEPFLDVVDNWKAQLQQYSSQALERMTQRNALTAPFATRQSVLKNGFPSQWTPCTIHNLIESKHKLELQSQPLRVVILGGSCSARAAMDCVDNTTGTNNPLTGRYSNTVQRLFDRDYNHTINNTNKNNNSSSKMAFQVEFINMAQGSTNSMLNGMTMDTLVDPTKADVLIWEFSPNESWGLHSDDPKRLEFWFARVKALFQQAQKPLPPILMLFLWERNIGAPRKRHALLQGGLSASADSALPYIEYFKQQQQWNVQALSVGSTVVNLTALADNPNMLIDDEIHPGCYTVHLIADMIQHSILANLATCPNDIRSHEFVEDSNNAVAMQSTNHDDVIRNDTAAVPHTRPPPILKLSESPLLEKLWQFMDQSGGTNILPDSLGA